MSDFDIVLVQKEKPKGGIMLFHGLTGSPFELGKFAKALFNEGYDVYCFCLPGHGDYPIDVYHVKYQDWLNFVREKYEELRPKYDKFYTGGLCLGAVLALYLAENYKNITGLICLSTTLFLDGWTIPKISFMLPIACRTILKYYYTFMEREPYGIKNPVTRKTIAKLMTKNTVALDNYPLNAIGELLALSKKVRKAIKKVETPILLIHSKDDDLTSPKSANFVYNNISSVKKELIILNDSYHLVLYDNEKDFVHKKTFEFLKMFEGTNCNIPLNINKNKEHAEVL